MEKLSKDQYKTIKVHPNIHYVISVILAKRANMKITEWTEEAIYKQLITDFGEKEVTEIESSMPSLSDRGYRTETKPTQLDLNS